MTAQEIELIQLRRSEELRTKEVQLTGGIQRTDYMRAGLAAHQQAQQFAQMQQQQQQFAQQQQQFPPPQQHYPQPGPPPPQLAPHGLLAHLQQQQAAQQQSLAGQHMMIVRVPPNVKAGDQVVMLSGAGGQQYVVQVPHGAVPGGQFQVAVPPNERGPLHIAPAAPPPPMGYPGAGVGYGPGNPYGMFGNPGAALAAAGGRGRGRGKRKAEGPPRAPSA